jgi:hypothetical protein
VQFLLDEGNQGVKRLIAPAPPLGKQNGDGHLLPGQRLGLPNPLAYRNIATLWTRSQWH